MEIHIWEQSYKPEFLQRERTEKEEVEGKKDVEKVKEDKRPGTLGNTHK